MTPGDMIAAAYKQQKLTGRKDAAVSFMVPGAWPKNERKRLLGRRGPLGQCVAEYEDAVLCVFKADEVIRFLSPLLPVVTMTLSRCTCGTLALEPSEDCPVHGIKPCQS